MHLLLLSQKLPLKYLPSPRLIEDVLGKIWSYLLIDHLYSLQNGPLMLQLVLQFYQIFSNLFFGYQKPFLKHLPLFSPLVQKII